MANKSLTFLVLLGLILVDTSMTVSAQTPKPAPFPTPVIGVIDFVRTVRSSSAGQDIIAQINEQHAAYQKEIQAVTATLEQSRQELARQQTLLNPKVFSERRAKFQDEARRLQQNVQKIKKQLDAAFAKGMKQVELVLAEILSKIAKEKGINIIMNAGRVQGTILFVDSRLVVSKEALKRLNARLPKVDLQLPKAKTTSVDAPAVAPKQQ
jgi:Skp family chaperone for outer membrane proteins